MRRTLPLTSLLLLLVAGPTAAAEIQFDVVHATGGLHRVEGLVPFHVRLQNPTAEDLTLRLEGGWDGGSPRVFRDVDLAAGARKELSFYLGPAAFASEFEIRLRGEDGELVGEALLNSFAILRSQQAVGVFGHHPLGWSTVRAEGLFEGRIVQLDAATLPDFGAALDVFDFLVWTRAEPRRLRPEQVSAVSRWIATGGRLVLTAAEVPPGEEIAPWTAVRTAELLAVHELPSLARLAGEPERRWREPMAVAWLDTDAGTGAVETVLSDRGAVAVCERRGMGAVIVLGFDPGDPRLAGWPGLGSLWLRLLEVGKTRIPPVGRLPVHRSDGGVDLRNMALGLLSQDPGGSPPPRRTLLWVLAVYLLAIGPGEYLLLRRWRRLTWTWVTFPVWVLLFSCGAYAVAVSSRTDVAVARHVLIRELWPGVATEELHASLYLPRAGRYTVRPRWPRALALAGDPGYGREIYYQYVHGGRHRSRNATQAMVPISEQGDAAVRSRLPRWSYLTASFLRETPPLELSVDAELDWSAGELTGRLTPRLGTDLAAAWVVAPRGRIPTVYGLGPLADGVAREVPGLAGEALELEAIRSWSYGDPPQKIAEVLTRLSGWRLRLSTIEKPDPQRGHQSWPESVDDGLGRRDWSPWLVDRGAVFIAWAVDTEARVDTGDTEAESRGIVVYRIPLTPPASRRQTTAGGDPR